LQCRTPGPSEPDDRGGALYLNNNACSVDFAGCLFQECRAFDRGGAMRIDNSLSFSMTGSTGLRCSSDYRYGFLCAYIDSTAGSMAVSETASVSCTSRETTMKLLCLAYWSGSKTSIDSLNVTGSVTMTFASGLYVEQHFNLSLHFCIFSYNRRVNCLFFSGNILNNDISCLILFSNVCTTEPDFEMHRGLICVGSPVTLSSCIFLSNTFDYFVAAYPGSSGTVAFTNCVSDFQSLRTTNSIIVSTLGWVINPNPTSLAECRTRTPMRSRTATIGRSPSAVPESAKIGIIVAVVVVVVLVLAVVVVAVLLAHKKNTALALSSDSLQNEWIH
jgi:hypothetical protein